MSEDPDPATGSEDELTQLATERSSFGDLIDALDSLTATPSEEALAGLARAVGERSVITHSEAGVGAEAQGISTAEVVLEQEGTPPPKPPTTTVTEFHVCAGLNACAGHDVTGTALIAGAGRCATSQHVCHGVGACRGQGGCGYSGSAYEQAIPAEQSCSHHGSCASPINECRVSTMGPNKGRSVWKLARKLFEARMFNSTVQFQPAPREGSSDSQVPSYVTEIIGVTIQDFATAKGSLCRVPNSDGAQHHDGLKHLVDGLEHDPNSDVNLCRATKPAS